MLFLFYCLFPEKNFALDVVPSLSALDYINILIGYLDWNAVFLLNGGVFEFWVWSQALSNGLLFPLKYNFSKKKKEKRKKEKETKKNVIR